MSSAHLFPAPLHRARLDGAPRLPPSAMLSLCGPTSLLGRSPTSPPTRSALALAFAAAPSSLPPIEIKLVPDVLLRLGYGLPHFGDAFALGESCILKSAMATAGGRS